MSAAPRGAIALACAVALLAGGCGGDPQPISAGASERLQRDLDTVAQLIASGQCRRVQYPLERLDRDVGNLPSEVDGDVRAALDDGVTRLTELADEDCRRQEQARETTTTEPLPETTTTETTSTTTTTPETTTTEPETTTTEPDTTTTPETTPTPPPTPPGDGGTDSGGGGGDDGGDDG